MRRKYSPTKPSKACVARLVNAEDYTNLLIGPRSLDVVAIIGPESRNWHPPAKDSDFAEERANDRTELFQPGVWIGFEDVLKHRFCLAAHETIVVELVAVRAKTAVARRRLIARTRGDQIKSSAKQFGESFTEEMGMTRSACCGVEQDQTVCGVSTSRMERAVDVVSRDPELLNCGQQRMERAGHRGLGCRRPREVSELNFDDVGQKFVAEVEELQAAGAFSAWAPKVVVFSCGLAPGLRSDLAKSAPVAELKPSTSWPLIDRDNHSLRTDSCRHRDYTGQFWNRLEIGYHVLVRAKPGSR